MSSDGSISVDTKNKHFVDNKSLENLIMYGELIEKYARHMDLPDFLVTEIEFTRMREDIAQYIVIVNSLTLTELNIIIEDDFFIGSVKSYIVKTYDGPINRLIPMYIKIPKVILSNLSGDVLCDTMSYHTFTEFSKLGGIGIFDKNVRRSRAEYFKNLFTSLEVIDSHARVVELLGSQKSTSRELFTIYRASLWKCMSMDNERIVMY